MGQREDYLEKGDELLKQGKYDEALKYFDSALDLNPKDDRAWRRRGDALEKLGKYNEALESYDKAIEINPKEELSWYSRGDVLEKLQRYGEALESYDKAIELEPKWWLSWYSRGDVLEKLQRYGEALESYNKAIEAAPDNALSFFAKGQLQVAQKQLIEALVSFQESLRLSEAKKDTDWIRLTEFWIQNVEKRIEEQKAKKEPPVEVQIIRNIGAQLRRTPEEDPLQILKDREKSYEEYFSKPRTIKSDSNFLAVLRRWNSFTPKIPNRERGKSGGGYFLVWKDKGIVIDPGFDFMDNFDREGYSIRDIDAIILTHAHTDHTADLESMLNLLYELSERVKGQHEVDLFMNLGTVNKFIGWISRLKGIGNIVSLNAGDSISPKGYQWTLHVKSTKHNELIGESAVGLVFELNRGSKVALKLGFTGDTGWSSSIQNQYRGCKLLILHLGSIGQNEFDEKLSLRSKERRYNGHLGLIGTISMVKSLKPSLSIISEFGEELGTDRCHIAKTIDCAFAQDKRCLTGDIGLKIGLPDLSVYCDVCENYQDYRDVQEMNVRAKEEIIYYCSSHTPQEVVDRLITAGDTL